MKTSPGDKNLPLPMKIAAAGLAGCTADLVTFPLDTIKVWLQVKGESGKASTAARAVATPSMLKPNTAVHSSKQIVKKQLGLRDNALKRLVPLVNAKLSEKSRKSLKSAMASNPKRQVSSSSQIVGASAVKKVAANARSSATLSVGEMALPGMFTSQNAPSLSSKATKPTNGAIQTITTNLKRHGVRSVYSGLNAGLQRQIGFCSVRIGFYDSVKNFYFDLLPGAPGSKMFGQRILAGATTGCMAVCLFQPAEVVKIQMQAASGRYKGTFQAYRHLFKIGGIAEMWKGIEANCARTAVVNVCELVTYDIVKESLLKRNLMQDKLPCHFASALISGLITTVVASPVDVVKTRFMNSEKGAYKNPIQCATHMFKSEGLKAFYKGFIPSYLRLGSWNIVMFVSYEQYKRVFGGKTSSVVSSRPATNLLPVVQPQISDPVYPAYVAAIFHSIHEAGPIS